MAAFAIFWASAFAILFFLLGIFFKAISSALNALLETVLGSVALIFLAFCGFLILSLFNEIVSNGLGNLLQLFGVLLLILVICGGLVGGLGALALELAVLVATAVFHVISMIAETLSSVCEWAYVFWLKIIINNLSRS